MGDLLARTLGPMVDLRFDLQSHPAVAQSDPTQLEMAVLNLAINARDAMSDGGQLTIASRRVAIAGDPELRAGDYVEIAVSDNGSGMPPEVIARAFDPFFTTKGVGRGTGLGLSQVYGIARQAEGTARIESTPGVGSTVRLLLRQTTVPVEEGQVSGTGTTREQSASATILVIDDDDDVRRMLTETLAMLGHRVMEAADGAAGLRLLARARPDILIVDFAMPGMNGAEVARQARASHPDLTILFASGYADTDAIEQAAGPGAPVLRKPFRIDELQALLAELLRG
jgi:CheY-like chemotaxis protein